MTPKLASALVRAGEENGWDIELSPAYSGRGMYGRKTAAVTCDAMNTLLGAVAYVAANCKPGSCEADDAIEEALKLRLDNLGRDVVVY